MPVLIGNKKIYIAVFISGRGSNLKNLIIHSLKKDLNIRSKLSFQINFQRKGLIMLKNLKSKKK